MTWRVAASLIDFRSEVNARWPNRDHRSDGFLGDAAHATRESDHNPWVIDSKGVGVVRAADTDVDGIDAAWLAEHIRRLGAAGDLRLNPGGYVIFNGRIAGSHTGWAWHVYTGPNPHRSHIHMSVSLRQSGYDSQSVWGIITTTGGLENMDQEEMDRLARANASAFFNVKLNPGATATEQVTVGQITVRLYAAALKFFAANTPKETT